MNVTTTSAPPQVARVASETALRLISGRDVELPPHPEAVSKKFYRHNGLHCPSACEEFPFDLIPEELFSFVQSLYPGKAITASNCVWYAKHGFMGWHTNEASPGKRVYITWADERAKSFFRYLDSNNVVQDSLDIEGVLVREFDIPQPPMKFWHCVYSECNRFSFGFKVQ